jgi:anti-anti-sigma regulatory factor
MLTVSAERFGKLAVVECKGRIVHSEDVFKLRDAVQAQASADMITLDLEEIKALGGGGLGMLVFLAKWARDRGVRFTLYGPSNPIVKGLSGTGSSTELEISSFPKMMEILMDCGEQPLAA